ncbi:MAG: Coenzyme F420 hydrogenase/dehydrogenase, beta subunit C-terminal domain [Armatimonadota bacterium]
MTKFPVRAGLPESLSVVVRSGTCCGCGVCAGVAPCAALEMRLTRSGYFLPHADDCTECGLCSSVCPGATTASASPHEPLGPFLETVVGYSTVNEERSQGSSGGLATRVLKTLLARGDVRAVIAATPASGGRALFEASALHTPEEIDRASGSKYYPIEFSGALRQVRSAGEPFAVVGLPCVITAVDLARKRFAWLRNQCRHLIGLTCGHLVTTHYTNFLAAISGVPPEHIEHVDYRRGPGPCGANDYRFVATRTNGTEGEELPFASGRGIPSAVWDARLFTPPACFRCTDLFAVHADLTLMDAWLPEYMSEPAGTSLAVVRSERMRDLLDAERHAGRVYLEPIAPDRVLASQRTGLAHRHRAAALCAAESGGRRVPLRDSVWLWWETLRSDLSNRLFAGGPLRRTLGTRLILAWLSGRRVARRLQSIGARLLRRPFRVRISRGGSG